MPEIFCFQFGFGISWVFINRGNKDIQNPQKNGGRVYKKNTAKSVIYGIILKLF